LQILTKKNLNCAEKTKQLGEKAKALGKVGDNITIIILCSPFDNHIDAERAEDEGGRLKDEL